MGTERIEKDRYNELEKDEIEFYAETESQKLNDDEEIKGMINQLQKQPKMMKYYAVDKEKRIKPFEVAIEDLSDEKAQLIKIREFVVWYYIGNYESKERVIQFVNKEIEDIDDRVKELEYEVEIIGGLK